MTECRDCPKKELTVMKGVIAASLTVSLALAGIFVPIWYASQRQQNDDIAAFMKQSSELSATVKSQGENLVYIRTRLDYALMRNRDGR